MAGLDRSVLLVGCGRLGSAMVTGWLASEAVDPARLSIVTPSEKPAAETARARGARINPSMEEQAGADVVVLAVKPGLWRAATAQLADVLSSQAIVISVMAGVRSGSLSEAFGARAVARVMPTTGVAQAQGVAALWAQTAAAGGTAQALFAPVAQVVRLHDEAMLDAATAVAGSGPAFIHAFVAAMATAGQTAGLDAEAAQALARGALRSAAAGAATGRALDDLIAEIASPGGTTRAGLDALAREGLAATVEAAVDDAVRRAGELSES